MTDVSKVHLVLYVSTRVALNRAAARQGNVEGAACYGFHGYSYIQEEPKVGMGIKKGIATPEGYDEDGKGKGSITLLDYYDGWASHVASSGFTEAKLLVEVMTDILALAEKIHAASIRIMGPSKFYSGFVSDVIPKWESSKNNADTQKLLDLYKAMIGNEVSITCESFDHTRVKDKDKKVKGTAATKISKRRLGIDMADRMLARADGFLLQSKEIKDVEVTPMKGYFKATDHSKDRFLSHPYLYYTDPRKEASMSKDGKQHVYHLGDIRDDEQFLGKPISDATFSVIYLNQPDPVIDLVKAEVEILGEKAMQGLIITDMKALFAGDLVDSIMRHGAKFMNLDARSQRVTHFNSTSISAPEPAVLAHELRPIRLGYNAIDLLDTMEDILNDYLNHGQMPHGRVEDGESVIEIGDDQNKHRMRYLDITSLFYDIEEVKDREVTKLKKHVTSTMRTVKVDAIYRTASGGSALHPITLTLGQDLPDRNTLSAIASEAPKVVLVSWMESPMVMRVAVVILKANGESGIWSGPYSNLWLIAKPVP